MLTFNTVLIDERIDPKDVRLVRHTEPHPGSKLYAVWRETPERLNEFQSVQGNKRKPFNVGNLLASFVVTPAPRSETLFVGLYEVVKVSDERRSLQDPIYENWFCGWQYDIRPDPKNRLSDYAGRLVVNWGGARRFVQHADRQSKEILALREEQEPPFSFRNFCL